MPPGRMYAHHLAPGRKSVRMELSPDLTRYFVWAGVVAAGCLLAVVDRRWIRYPVFGVLLVSGVGGGFLVEKVSPFSFGVESHYMEGVIVSAGSALALIGYVLALAWQLVRRRIGVHTPS
jgi:hypothetical protein